MGKWYKNKNLEFVSKACDAAYFSNDENKMSTLIDECYNLGHDKNNSHMVRAKYLYNCYTVLSDLITKRMKHDEATGLSTNRLISLKKYEQEFEKCFYLARTAFDLIHLEMENDEKVSDIDLVHFQSFYFQMLVNYSNLLYQNGRVIKSLEFLGAFRHNSFPMGTGNLGMKIYELSKLHYDGKQQSILLYEAYKCIHETLNTSSKYGEQAEVIPLLSKYYQWIVSILGKDYLEKEYTLNDFLTNPDNMSADEIEYREWMAENKLSLNLLNDVFVDPVVGYDPIFLPTIVGGEEVQYLQGLLNQIKQEYVSARFLAYEGLTKREPHFSDKEVMLINTLDYPVYGLGIEKIKACYRAVYSIFDKTAYLLNEYFELGIKKQDVGYYRIWSPTKTAHDAKKLIDIAETNYSLLGMWWLFKDIRNIHVSNSDKYVDPVMSRISKVRNAMEHAYLKILDSYDVSEFNNDIGLDKLAYNIGFSDFEKLTLSLLKYAREAIISLIFSIKCEEENKATLRNPNEILIPMYTDTYDDEWKQIFS